MNPFDKAKEMLDDDVRFDRLVDGELAADEYQALIAGLDDEPGGWRRCALAFLEAQALGGELAAIRRSCKLAEEPTAAVTVTSRKAANPAQCYQGRAAQWRLVLAMSASFLVAFILGVTLPGLWRAGGTVPEGVSKLAVSPMETQPGMAMPENLIRTVGNARLVVFGPGGTQSPAGVVPIYELPAEASNSWLTQHDPMLPVELVKELERRGHRVQRQEEYVPVNLEDGREGVIPVESYQITPVSRRAY
jgi:hypothetical protein